MKKRTKKMVKFISINTIIIIVLNILFAIIHYTVETIDCQSVTMIYDVTRLVRFLLYFMLGCIIAFIFIDKFYKLY